MFGDSHREQLFALDRQVTEILLDAENQCSKKGVGCNLWSPALQKVGRDFVYWKGRLRANGLMDGGTKALGEALGIPANIQTSLSLQLCQFYSNIAWKSYRGIQSQAHQHH